MRFLRGGGSLNVLPFLMTLLNITSTLLYTKGFSLKEKIPLFGMAALFLALLYNASSGLVLYWTMNNLFSCAKNGYSRVAFKAKKFLLALLFSLLCLVPIPRIWYMLQHAPAVCAMATVFLIGLAALPFFILLIKKTGLRLPSFSYNKNKNFALFALSFAGSWMITGVLIPALLIASSPEEFVNIGAHSNPLYFAANTALQCAGFFLVWPLALYLLFPQKVKKALALGGLILFAALLCGAFLFPGNYGILSPDMSFNNGVRHSLAEILVNAGVLAALAAALFGVVVKGGFRFALPAALLPLAAVTALSAHTIGTVWNAFTAAKEFITPSVEKNGEKSGEITPLFHLSKTGKNTIVIMLDRATSIFFPEILKEKPELAAVYEGFIYYPNTVSFNGYTRLGSPPLFGGYEYTPLRLNERSQVSMREKHNEALLLLPRLFSEAGY